MVVTHLVLGQVVRKVGDHNLGLGRNAVLRGTTLLLGAGRTRLALLLGSLIASSLVVVGSFGQRGLVGSISTFLSLRGLLMIMSVLIEPQRPIESTYTTTTATATTATSATTATAPSTSTLTALTAAGTFTTTGSTFLGLGRLGLAGQLHGHLAREDLLARETFDSCGSFVGSGEIHKGVANRAVGAGVHRDRGALAGKSKLVIVDGACRGLDELQVALKTVATYMV